MSQHHHHNRPTAQKIIDDTERTGRVRYQPKTLQLIDYDVDAMRTMLDSPNPRGAITQMAGPCGIMRRLGSDMMRGIDPDTVGDRVSIGGANHFRSNKNIAKMVKEVENEEVGVIRDGQIIRVMGRDLVIGDLLVVEAGMKMPADCVMVAGHASVFDGTVDARATGLMPKAPDEDAVMHSSAEVREGAGKAVVVAVGENSSFSKLLKEM